MNREYFSFNGKCRPLVTKDEQGKAIDEENSNA